MGRKVDLPEDGVDRRVKQHAVKRPFPDQQPLYSGDDRLVRPQPAQQRRLDGLHLSVPLSGTRSALRATAQPELPSLVCNSGLPAERHLNVRLKPVRRPASAPAPQSLRVKALCTGDTQESRPLGPRRDA